MEVTLVYLSRGADDGLAAAKSFFEAYQAHPPGCAHELIVIAKGWSGIEGRRDVAQLAEANGGHLVELPDDGFDWGAYMRLAPMLKHEWVSFVNTHSRPRVEGWLNTLKMTAEKSGASVGSVGATASWESSSGALPTASITAICQQFLTSPTVVIRSMARFLKNIWVFPAFPNPHLRSNAFIVRSKLFQEFVATQSIPRRKRDAHKMESGRRGFSMYLKNRGLTTLVAGANGQSYDPRHWADSHTFRVPGQSNLLVADNQTTAYELADVNLQKILERRAWGKPCY